MSEFTRKLSSLLLIPVCLLLAGKALAQYETVSMPIEGEPSLRICMTCHGAYGQGNPSVGGPRLAGMEPWYLRKQLLDFRNGIRGNQLDYIPAYEMRDTVRHFSDQQIDDIVMQVSAWSASSTADANETTVNGDVAHGQTLYQTCAACHGAAGEGNEALGAPALQGRSDWYLVNQLNLYKSGYRGSHPEDAAGAQMRLMIGSLESAADIESVVAYINTLE